MDDAEIVAEISRLADEEHALEQARVGEGSDLSAEQSEKLRTIEVALDRCWDLLRQRRARRAAGQDPDDAAVRPAPVVENYQQ
jgi:hypothetical protein